MTSTGFGYNNVSPDNYKILKCDNVADKSYGKIYEFKSKLWRSVDAALDGRGVNRHAVSINGNMYWIVYRTSDNSEFS